MFIPLPVLIAIGGIALLIFFMLRGRATRRQRDSLLDVSVETRRNVEHVVPPPQEIEAQARALLGEGKKIDAIKLVREATGLGLKEAKDYVEGL